MTPSIECEFVPNKIDAKFNYNTFGQERMKKPWRFSWYYPANIYLFKVNSRNTKNGLKYVQS